MSDLKKIALLGPESTGKSELCCLLAEHYKTVCVPEYAREYIGGLKRKYSLDDVIHCLEKQIEDENKKSFHANQLLFCDTDMINFKVWCSDVFKEIPLMVEDFVEKHRYDFHLLTFPDVSFVPDNVRENPMRREFFFDWYKKELEAYGFPYAIIKGQGEERLKNAIAAVEKFISL